MNKASISHPLIIFVCELNTVVLLNTKNLYATLILGQNYVFDVRQTGREVYDQTRRKLFRQISMRKPSLVDEEESEEETSTPLTQESSTKEVKVSI